MKRVKTVLIGLVALILLLILVGLFLPSAAHVERSTSIAAPPAAVFDLVNNLKRFNEWSPWYELDPSARFTYSGPEQGVGSRVQWSSSNPELGSGTQEIVASEPNKRVGTQLDFGDQGKASAELRLAPEGEGTNVTWAFHMQFGFNLLRRYFGLLLDRILGPYYEKGLGNLKVVVEAEPVHVGPRSSLPDTYRQLEDHMAQHNLEPNGRSWEQYVGGPSSAPPERLRTDVYIPIKPGR